MTVQIGDSLPDVTLKTVTEDGPRDVRLADYKGKPLVILFFPLTNTGVCEKELCSVRDDYSAYEGLGAQVVAISVDSPFAHKLWKEKQNFPFTLLSDFNKEAIRAFGNAHEELIGLKGVAKRSAFVADKEGKVVYAWVSDDPKQLPDFAGIKKALERIA